MCLVFFGDLQREEGVAAGDPTSETLLLALVGASLEPEVPAQAGERGVGIPGAASLTSWLTPAPAHPVDVALRPPVSPHHCGPDSPHQR